MHELHAVGNTGFFLCTNYNCRGDENFGWFSLGSAIEHAVKNQYKVKDESAKGVSAMWGVETLGRFSMAEQNKKQKTHRMQKMSRRDK